MFYKLKAKYGGVGCVARQSDPQDWSRVGVTDAKRLKQLEGENSKLNRLVANVMLDNVVLKDLLGKP